jgi:hypothetical protein
MKPERMADEGYVELERRFSDVLDAPSSAWFRRAFRSSSGKPWDELVPVETPPADIRSAVVVLGASGLGKSAELGAHASRLRAAGVPAFFMRAGDVAARGVAGALADSSPLLAWQASSARAVFFLDAVDEARLEGHDLERVMLRFAQDIDPGTKTLQLVLSSRHDVWAATEVRHIVRALDLPREPALTPLKIVRLEPLSEEDVKLYARANGIADADAFMTAFDEEELDSLFELRPPDVKILVEYWKHHGAFGSWSEMLQASVEASVRNENRRYALQQQFTLEEATKGLARLGAATVLGKKPLISLRGTSRVGEVSAERLFADSRPASTTQLLTMGLFAQKGYEAVQLPQGPPSHFLAAVWLGERARRGWDLRALEEVLFVRPFGVDLTLAVPSRAPVVGWVAGFVPPLRKRLHKELPHVLLFEGDPGRLSRGDCIEALRGVLADIRAGRHEPSPTKGTLRQIAKQSIAEEVVRLLAEFAGVPGAERLLLRLAGVGGYSAAVAAALALASSADTSEGVRTVAIHVVSRLGTEDERRSLLGLAVHPSEWVHLALVQALAPRTLNGTTLVNLVLATTDHSVGHLLALALADVALSDIDAILTATIPILDPSKVEARAESMLEIASRLAVVRLGRSSVAVPAWMADLLLAIEGFMVGPFHIDREVIDALDTHLVSDDDMRRNLWSARMSEPDAGGRLMSARLGRARATDVEWFWRLREDTPDEQLKFALRWPLGAALDAQSPLQRATMLQAESLDLNLKAYVEKWVADGALAAASEKQRQAKLLSDQAELRAKNIAEVKPNRERIESGEDGHALAWAWSHLTGTESHRSRLGTGRLIELLGPDLANAFMNGLQRWWRRHEPEMRDPGSNTVMNKSLAGLTGLSLDIERGLDLAALSDADVDRAVRYALHELNGFPVWFEALLAAHPNVVTEVLRRVVSAEWATTTEHHGIIARAPYEAERTSEVLRDLVMRELERGAPAHARTIHYAVGALLIPTPPSQMVGALLEKYVVATSAGEVVTLAEWLRGWSHFCPEQAARWLRKLSTSDRARFLSIVSQVASLLEDDLDERHQRIAPTGWTPDALEAWVRLLHVAVRPEDDIDRSGKGVYSPGERDRAQSFRNRCISRLANHPSRGAFEALRRIRASKEMAPYAAMVDRVIRAQLTTAAEELASPWSEADVLTLERGDERPPATNADLFALVRRHIARVAELLENDDFSYAKLFGEKAEEREVQRWVASSLVLVGRGLYTVERESQVQDDKLMDISVTVPGVGRVPVEIKPLYASRYTYSELCDFVTNQLIGLYMKPPAVDRGIFLLVPLKSRTWKVDGHVLSFKQLQAKLARHAAKAGSRAYKEVVVASIDVAGARGSKDGKRGRRDRTETITADKAGAPGSSPGSIPSGRQS